MFSRVDNTSSSISPFDLFTSRDPGKTASLSAENISPTAMTKPQLNPNPIRHLLAVNEKAVSTAEKMAESHIQEVETERNALEQLRAQQVQRLQEALKREDFSSFWGIIAKVSSMVIAAISTIVGTFICTTGGSAVVGGAMIASGVLSIANLTLEESGGWDWIADKLAQENEEFRKTLRVLLPAGIGAICGLTGLLGASLDWNSLNSASQFLTVAQTASNFIAAAMTGAQGVFLAQNYSSQAEHLNISRQVTQKEDCLEELVNRFIVCQNQIRKSLDSASRAISLESKI